MKKIFIIAFMLVALCAQGVTKVKTQHFEVRDSIRLIEKEDPESLGYKLTVSVSADWPVTINGKKSSALSKFLLDSVFYASHNRDIFTSYPTDVNVVRGMVSEWVSKSLQDNQIAQEYDIKNPDRVPDINREDEPMSCWYESMVFTFSHQIGNLIFFSEYNDCYYGGAHNMFFTSYHAFDIALDRPIHLKDIVTSPNKLLKMLPAYDRRDADVKWWDYITTDNIENFYVKNGKLVFVFAPYAIGPFCDGEIEVSVPLKTLRAKKMLTTYGKKFLK